MKTIIKKEFDAVKFMRENRDKLSLKLSEMSVSEMVEYFKKKKLMSEIKPCA